MIFRTFVGIDCRAKVKSGTFFRVVGFDEPARSAVVFLNFVAGNDEFKLSTGGRIVPGQASFNLYVPRVYQGGRRSA
jgi:hypothetical protein